MKTTLVTIIFFLGSIIFCHGQSNYKQGYIITNEMDTIYGWIDYRTDAMNALECNFKTDEKSQKQTYLPGTIFGYRLANEGKFYISKNITINNVSQMVFVEFLVQGIVNLYYYMSSKDPLSLFGYYIYEDETGKMTVITKKPDQDVHIDDLTIYKKVDNSYKGIMRYLFQNSDAAMKDIDRLQFTQQSMIDITKDYHRQMCTTGEDCIVFAGTPDKHYTLFNFSVYAGYQIYHDVSWGDSWSPTIGGRMNTTVPRFNKYLSFQLDLSLSRTSGKYIEDGEYFDIKYHNEYDLSQILLPAKFGFKYTFSKYKLRPSVELGGVFHSYIHKKIIARESYMGISHRTYNFDGDLGYYAGCGLDYALKNKHAIFFGASIDQIPGIVNLIQFKLGYTW